MSGTLQPDGPGTGHIAYHTGGEPYQCADSQWQHTTLHCRLLPQPRGRPQGIAYQAVRPCHPVQDLMPVHNLYKHPLRCAAQLLFVLPDTLSNLWLPGFIGAVVVAALGFNRLLQVRLSPTSLQGCLSPSSISH